MLAAAFPARPGPRTHLHQGRGRPEAHLGHRFALASPRKPAAARAGAGEGAEGSGTRRDRRVRGTQAVSRVIRHAEGPAPGQGVYDLADGRRCKSPGLGRGCGGRFPTLDPAVENIAAPPSQPPAGPWMAVQGARRVPVLTHGAFTMLCILGWSPIPIPGPCPLPQAPVPREYLRCLSGTM